MRRKKATELDEIAAAYLLANENRSQATIAELLGVSAPVVSRLIARARKKDYLIKEFRFVEERLKPEMMQAVRQRLSRSRFAGRLDELSRATCGRPGPTVRVFPSSSETHDSDVTLRAFAVHAAPHIHDLLLRSELCGVTWGRMLLNLVVALRHVRVPSAPRRREVIPLAGEPLGKEPTTSSSSTLANELGRIMNEDNYQAKSLTMVPALVPKDFNSAERRAVYKLVERLPDYGEIFGRVGTRQKTNTLAHRVDCILTSLGREPLGFSDGSLLNDSEQRLFVGDIGGVLIPRAKLGKADRQLEKDIEARWTGLRQEHVEACADRARAAANTSNSPPGVVIVSVGEKRAPVVLEAIRGGLANHLVIDSELEYALSTLIPDSS
jgi:DNA-binding transcriptional regulator LsrR (DeoR family)